MNEFVNTWVFHWSPAKAIWFGQSSLSWDARCAGIYVGFALGAAYHAALGRRASRLPPIPVLLFAALVFFAPLAADVYAISDALWPASNDLRFLTGLLFGNGLSLFVCPAFVAVCLVGEPKTVFPSPASVAGLFGCSLVAHLGALLGYAPFFYLYESLGIGGNVALYFLFAFGVAKYLSTRETYGE